MFAVRILFNLFVLARGSAKCLERPACEKKDYMEISSECDEENKVCTDR